MGPGDHVLANGGQAELITISPWFCLPLSHCFLVERERVVTTLGHIVMGYTPGKPDNKREEAWLSADFMEK